MVVKPIYCTDCRHAFEYDTRRAGGDKFRYAVVCPECGKENRRLKPKYLLLLESIGIFLGFFIGLYYLFHDSFFPSLLAALILAVGNGIISYHFRVRRPEREARKTA